MDHLVILQSLTEAMFLTDLELNNFSSFVSFSLCVCLWLSVGCSFFLSISYHCLSLDRFDFVPNFDDSQKEPSLLPARVPSLLLKGSSGIEV